MLNKENTASEIKRVKNSFLAKISRNTENGNLFSYRDYSRYLKVDTYTLKMVVKDLIADGYPIISLKRDGIIGLVICTNDEDYNAYVKNIEFKISRMQEKIDNIKRNYIKNNN